jgi:hypothetical protein
MPTSVLQNETPIFRLLKIQPNYEFLRTFGCACWPSLRKYNAHKLAFRSKLCVFLGYSAMHKGYKCLDRSTGRIYISRDVVFDESVFPYATPGVTVDLPALREAITFPSSEPATNTTMRKYDLSYLSTDVSGSDDVFVQHVQEVAAASPVIDVHAPGTAPEAGSLTSPPRGSPAPAASSPCGPSPCGSPELASTSASGGAPASPPPASPVMQQPVSPLADSPSAATSPAAAPGHSMVTRTRDETRREKKYTDGTVRYNPSRRAFFAAPTSHRDAL